MTTTPGGSWPTNLWPTSVTATPNRPPTPASSFWIDYTPGDPASATPWTTELNALRAAVAHGTKVLEIRFGSDTIGNHIAAADQLDAIIANQAEQGEA